MKVYITKDADLENVSIMNGVYSTKEKAQFHFPEFAQFHTVGTLCRVTTSENEEIGWIEEWQVK